MTEGEGCGEKEEEAVEQEENDSFLERHEDSSALQAKGMQDDSRGGNFDSGVRFSESLRRKFAIEFDKEIPRKNG